MEGHFQLIELVCMELHGIVPPKERTNAKDVNVSIRRRTITFCKLNKFISEIALQNSGSKHKTQHALA